ncbi:Acetyl-CoA acetyltransferase [Cedecea neteri]|uniref:Acetyl-CoA C-acetyltransferase n=1 Tax=Cedecea neteri TaxID=158822 RepID=A0A291E640_9ENTR|nr:acetyl-CoA C-acetyltransferase [Cedecea neteri]ATF95525.1 acetyl-CoA C-acetyltransferase [Cedecea neteri]SQC92026.1 Acetyl-CoA acetyltransferase [Cedecea neteri]
MRIFIVAAKRTPIGSFRGAFSTVPAVTLGAAAIQGTLADSRIDAGIVDEVIVGNVIGAGQGMGIGRQVAVQAGIPHHVPAYSLNMVCGSGMKAVMEGCAHIKAGESRVVVAAGTENMSRIPFALDAQVRGGVRPGNVELQDLLISDGLTDAFHQYHMGLTAENIAVKLGISREQQDQFAFLSQFKAAAALEQGRFKKEIIPVEVSGRHGVSRIDQDEYPKPDTTLSKLSRLTPAFCAKGTVTAGNASGLNDGASALLIASEEAVEQYRLEPMAEILSYAQAGVDPEIMGLGPVQATLRALAGARLRLDEIDICECNEAFAAQTLGVLQELSRETGVSFDTLLARTNPNGGAIALGHPLGASGNRIVVSLLYEMRRCGARHGLATLCIGGGMGTAIILKSL